MQLCSCLQLAVCHLQGELCVRTNEYDADGNLTSYKEYVYEADGSCTITEYNADGTVVYTNVCEYEYLDG